MAESCIAVHFTQFWSVAVSEHKHIISLCSNKF